MATINFKDPELIENMTISMKIWTYIKGYFFISFTTHIAATIAAFAIPTVAQAWGGAAMAYLGIV